MVLWRAVACACAHGGRRWCVCGCMAIVMAASPPAAAQIAIKIFDEPTTIQSFTIGSTVLDVPGALKRQQHTTDFSLEVSTHPLVGSYEMGGIGRTATSTRSFGYYVAVGGFASADAWSEFSVVTPPIPTEVKRGDDLLPVEALEIDIKGRVREANLDAVACGAAWTAELRGVHFGAPGPPEADYEFPSVGCIVPEGEIYQAIDDIQTAFDIIGKIDQVFQVAAVGLGVWEDFVVRIPLYDVQVPRNQPLNLIVQLGRRAGSALAAAGVSGGEIDVSEIRVVGWAGIGPTTYLRTWHHYGNGGATAKRLMEEVAFDVKKAQQHIEPFPTATFTCPPYPIHRPVTRLRSRIYVTDFDWLWRLEYLELDSDPRSRVPVPDETCRLGPIVMDRSHRVAFGFQQGVADFVITGFRTVPAQPQAGQRFDLNIAVRNVGDLSTLEADRNSPLSGGFKFRIKVGTAETTLGELRVLQPGESWEFYGLQWTCNGSVDVTVDTDNDIEEGPVGEQNNTAHLTLPLCEAATPTPTAPRTPTPTATVTPIPVPTRTPTATITGAPTATRSATASPVVTTTPTIAPGPICVGDCDARLSVTVDELLTMVNIALGNLPLSDCRAGNRNDDHAITIDEILVAVRNAVAGCPVA